MKWRVEECPSLSSVISGAAGRCKIMSGLDFSRVRMGVLLDGWNEEESRNSSLLRRRLPVLSFSNLFFMD
jgi:hypothetical protein